MAEDNITVAVFSGGGRETTAASLWQYDYGQILQFAGIPELPTAYEVQFSNDREKGSAKTQIGSGDGVAIPDEFLATGKPVFAWVFLHAGEEDGETVYQVTIPVRRRSRATDAPPTPQQQSVITETIAALNAAVAQSEANVSHYPMIVNSYWVVWDAEEAEYVATGVKAEGEDGYSPVVTITEISGGHRVTITDAEHPDGQSFDVMDGTGGGGGTSDYEDLSNLPQIAGVTLIGNKTLAELGAGTYSKPSGGIPKTDLASGVQGSLDKADTAYQEPSGGIPKTDLASGVQGSLDKADAALPKTGGTMSGAIAMGGSRITGLGAGVNDGDAATKKQLNDAIAGLGTVFTIKGDVAAVADLPASGNTVGDVYYVRAVSAAFVWLETTEHPNGYWEEFGEPIDLSGYIQKPSGATVNQYLVFNGTTWVASNLPAIPSTAADVGAIAAPSSPASGQYLQWNGSSWVAASLPVYNGGVS